MKVTANVNPITLILALCHFIARKGLPKLIVCDDFKTFKAKLIKAFCRSNGICWKFILDQSSWWSGFYEHLIASVKISLKILGKAPLNYSEIHTILWKVGNCINSKPLTYFSDEHFREALITYHLRLGRNLFADTTSPIKNSLTAHEARN